MLLYCLYIQSVVCIVCMYTENGLSNMCEILHAPSNGLAQLINSSLHAEYELSVACMYWVWAVCYVYNAQSTRSDFVST